MDDQQPDHYTFMTLARACSQAEIQHQYRRLAKIYHPDRNPGEEEWCADQLKKLNAAYAILGDPVRRAAYDRDLNMQSRRSSGPVSGGSQDYATTGDGRSIYTRWRPDVPVNDPSMAPQTATGIGERTMRLVRSSLVKKPRPTYRKSHIFSVFVASATVCLAVAFGVARYVSNSIELAPIVSSAPDYPPVKHPHPSTHSAHGLRIASYRTGHRHAQLVAMHRRPHSHGSATALSPAEKDLRAEQLAAAAEAKRHEHNP